MFANLPVFFLIVVPLDTFCYVAFASRMAGWKSWWVYALPVVSCVVRLMVAGTQAQSPGVLGNGGVSLTNILMDLSYFQGALLVLWELVRRAQGRANVATPTLLLALVAVQGVFHGIRKQSISFNVLFGVSGGDLMRWTMLLLAGVIAWYLIRELLRERSRVAEELQAARGVQSVLLTASVPDSRRFAMDVAYLPAREVGGDFYYAFDDADGSRLVVVGDVSGKGLQAALLVSSVIGALRSVSDHAPERVLAHLNRALYGAMGGGFATCCCVRVDVAGRAMVASAGHPAPYLDGREVEAPAGLPLGVVAEAEWEEAGFALGHGQLTLLSDGVLEAANGQGELFGFERTREWSGKRAGDIARVAQGWGQNDDITVVTVRRAVVGG